MVLFRGALNWLSMVSIFEIRTFFFLMKGEVEQMLDNNASGTILAWTKLSSELHHSTHAEQQVCHKIQSREF